MRLNLRKKTCVHSGRYSLDLFLMNMCQHVCYHEKRIDLKVDHVGLETRPLAFYMKVKITEF